MKIKYNLSTRIHTHMHKRIDVVGGAKIRQKLAGGRLHGGDNVMATMVGCHGGSHAFPVNRGHERFQEHELNKGNTPNHNHFTVAHGSRRERKRWTASSLVEQAMAAASCTRDDGWRLGDSDDDG